MVVVLRVGTMVVVVVIPEVVGSMHHEPQPLAESRTHEPLQQPSHGTAGNPTAPAHRAFSGVHVAPGGVVAVTLPPPGALVVVIVGLVVVVIVGLVVVVIVGLVVVIIATGLVESMHHEPQPLAESRTHEPLQQPSHGIAGNPAAPAHLAFSGVQVAPGGVIAVTPPPPGAGATVVAVDTGAVESIHHEPQPLEVSRTQFPLQHPPSHGTAGNPGAPMQRSFRGVHDWAYPGVADKVTRVRTAAAATQQLLRWIGREWRHMLWRLRKDSLRG
jgi:hypothetical protein